MPRSRDPSLIFGPIDICTVNYCPLVGLCLDSNEDRGATEYVANLLSILNFMSMKNSKYQLQKNWSFLR